MKTFGKLLSEVAQPKAEDEIHFKAKHKIDRIPHSHAGDEVFKGSTKKTPKRRADYENGDDEGVYEAMDPVGKEDDDIDNDGDVDSSDKYLHARRKAISKAIKKRKMNEQDTKMGTITVNSDEERKKRAAAYRAKKMKSEEVDIDESYTELSILKKRIARDTKKMKSLPDFHPQKKKIAILVAKDKKRLDDLFKKQFKNEEVELDEADAVVTHKWYSVKNWKDGSDHFDNLDNHLRGMSYKHAAIGNTAKNRPDHHLGIPVKAKAAIAYMDKHAKPVNESMNLDEISPNLLHRYIKGASKDLAKKSRMSGYADKSGNYDDSDKNRNKANKRLAGITSASGRLADKANMAEDAWEEIPMMSRQLQFIMYAAQEIVSYLNDCDDMCVDPEEWFQNKLAHVHGQMMTLHGYIEGDRRMNMSMYGEETELDEVSFELAKRARDKGFEKMAKSIGSSRKKPSGAYEYIPATDAEMELAKKGARQAKMASRAMTRAHNKKRTGRYEEAELDEVTRSAIKRPINYTDARGVTRTRMTTTRPVQHDEYGQEKMRESLEEAVKPGKLKLDDGSSVTVSKKDADLINQMFNDLNKKNRKMMQDTLMTDKAGYEEIVGFAREAL